ncbi:unnamed protein product [Closterium sp. Naga37s-1]|nr:unnamed protein product [Closterium sp. Naga37s-1]
MRARATLFSPLPLVPLVRMPRLCTSLTLAHASSHQRPRLSQQTCGQQTRATQYRSSPVFLHPAIHGVVGGHLLQPVVVPADVQPADTRHFTLLLAAHSLVTPAASIPKRLWLFLNLQKEGGWWVSPVDACGCPRKRAASRHTRARPPHPPANSGCPARSISFFTSLHLRTRLPISACGRPSRRADGRRAPLITAVSPRARSPLNPFVSCHQRQQFFNEQAASRHATSCRPFASRPANKMGDGGSLPADVQPADSRHSLQPLLSPRASTPRARTLVSSHQRLPISARGDWRVCPLLQHALFPRRRAASRHTLFAPRAFTPRAHTRALVSSHQRPPWLFNGRADSRHTHRLPSNEFASLLLSLQGGWRVSPVTACGCPSRRAASRHTQLVTAVACAFTPRAHTRALVSSHQHPRLFNGRADSRHAASHPTRSLLNLHGKRVGECLPSPPAVVPTDVQPANTRQSIPFLAPPSLVTRARSARAPSQMPLWWSFKILQQRRGCPLLQPVVVPADVQPADTRHSIPLAFAHTRSSLPRVRLEPVLAQPPQSHRF